MTHARAGTKIQQERELWQEWERQRELWLERERERLLERERELALERELGLERERELWLERERLLEREREPMTTTPTPRLAAAAPEMRDALLNILTLVNRIAYSEADEQRRILCSDIRWMIHKVIARAEGL